MHVSFNDCTVYSHFHNDTFFFLFTFMFFFLFCYFSISAEYEVGTPAPRTPCSFTVDSSSKRTGNILSPTYPGTYPKDLACRYKFIGKPGQRVRLEFRDFDLFFGGPQYAIPCIHRFACNRVTVSLLTYEFFFFLFIQLSIRLREGARWSEEFIGGDRHLLRSAAKLGAIFLESQSHSSIRHPRAYCQYAESWIQGNL